MEQIERSAKRLSEIQINENEKTTDNWWNELDYSTRYKIKDMFDDYLFKKSPEKYKELRMKECKHKNLIGTKEQKFECFCGKVFNTFPEGSRLTGYELTAYNASNKKMKQLLLDTLERGK